MEVNKEKRVMHFDFSPFRSGWADVVLTPSGYHFHRMEDVFKHYGFSDVLAVQGLTYCLVNNGKWELKFRECNAQLISVYICPAKQSSMSVREFMRHTESTLNVATA